MTIRPNSTPTEQGRDLNYCGDCSAFLVTEPHKPECPRRKRDITTEGAETKDTLGGGATRTKSLYRFDLIPHVAERREALRFGAGAVKHGEGNWQKGDWTFVVSCVGHIKAHLNTLIEEQGNDRDDNLGAVRWNSAALCWYEANKPEEFAKALIYLRTGKKPE